MEVCAVQLPGREWRRREPAFTRVDAIVDALFEVFPESWFTTPYVFFGYSMGALVAFELLRRFKQAGRPLPRKLVVAACRAPHFMSRFVPRHDMQDAEFLELVRRFGGTPDAILAEPELLKILLPTLRADFEVLDTYRYTQNGSGRIDLPFLVYGGTRDSHVKRSDLAGWREYTSGEFTLRLFPGGHFFINEVREQFFRTLRQDLLA
jgi:medium-chain acyl-[acyl-carrier-protein] hydrolase